MSCKKVLDGFSRILDIQNFYTPPQDVHPLSSTWKMGYMEWTLILQNLPSHHHYQPARVANSQF